MKKLLLTLFAAVAGFACHICAQDLTDVLTYSNFTGMTYDKAVEYTSTVSKAKYSAKASDQQSFQIRSSKAGTGIEVKQAPDGYVVKSLKIEFSSVGSGVNVYFGDAAISLTSLPTTVDKFVNAATTISDINKAYFSIAPAGNTVIKISNVTVTWTKAGGGETPVEPVAPTELVVKYGDKTVAENEKVEVNKGTKFEISAKDATSIVVTDAEDNVLNDPTVYPCVWEPEVMAEELIFVTAKNGELEGESFGFELTVKDDGTVTPEPGEEYKDELVIGNFPKVTASQYTSDTYTSTVSGVTYSARVAKGNNAIQLNAATTTDNRGIVVTSNPKGYIVKSVKMELNNNTSTKGRTLIAYGFDEPLTSTAGITDGESIGSITYSETSASVNLTAKKDFKAIGFAASGGALYIDKITVVWKKSEGGEVTPPTPQKTAAPEFSPAGGVLYKGEKFTLSCKTEGAIIKYSIDGGMEQAYSAAIGFEDEGKYEISAYAYVEGEEENRSETVNATFTYAAVERPEIPEPIVDTLKAQSFGVEKTTYKEYEFDNTAVSGAYYKGYMGGAYPSGVTQTGPANYFSIRRNSKQENTGAIIVTKSDKVVTGVSVKQWAGQSSETTLTCQVYGSADALTECSNLDMDNLSEGVVLIGEAAMIKGQHVAIELEHYYPYIMIIPKTQNALQCEEIKVTWEKRFDPPTVDFAHNGKLSEGGSVHFDFRHSFADARTYWKHEPLQSAASAARKAPSHNDTDWEELTDDVKFVDIKDAGTLYAYSSDLSGKNRSHIARFDVTDENTTSISDVNVESNEPVMWFDLQGRRLAEPTRSGVYIRRQGSSVGKVRF